ncbi:hypothetical protein JSE7799_01489 [Jannaschia seosinensis]|uniref:Uncharacterized protein n=1 Tax=Jannaschia seosinensis TaxID=313367 RepID=A0A0M7BBQ7_9RHOB|nr:hypothetical protein JSE7799_01489 [Jannaschia seosinensis]
MLAGHYPTTSPALGKAYMQPMCISLNDVKIIHDWMAQPKG